MTSLGLSYENVQLVNGEPKQMGQPANTGLPGKMATKTVCVHRKARRTLELTWEKLTSPIPSAGYKMLCMRRNFLLTS